MHIGIYSASGRLSASTTRATDMLKQRSPDIVPLGTVEKVTC